MRCALGGLLLAMSVVACNFPTSQMTQIAVVTSTPTPLLDVGDTVTVNPPTINPTVASVEPPITATASSGTPLPTETPQPSETPGPTETPPPTLDMPYDDATMLLSGVCFKLLQTLAGQTISMNSGGDLATFYDSADKAKKCSEAATRQRFDFTSHQLIGTVIAAQGCGLGLVYNGTQQDDGTRTRTITIHVTVTGDCPYALLQPLLLSIDRTDYKTELQIQR
ncbi:MAG: hypothetical protein ABI947_07480 [Chloroflexota bacterium]